MPALPSPERPAARAEVRGLVTDRNGVPLAGAHVVITRLALDTGLPVGAVTGPDGCFRLEVLALGPHRVVISAPGHARAVRRVDLARGERRDLGRVRLGQEALLAGRVVTGKGEPVAGAVVSAVDALSPAAPGIATPVVAVSGVDGGFVLQGLTAGSYRLRASREGFASLVRRQVAAPGAGVTLTLQPLAVLAGRVTRAGQPAAGADVFLVGTGAWPPRRLRTGAAGTFRFEGLQPGLYQVWAEHDTWLSAPSGYLEVVPGAPGPGTTLRLEEGGVFSGRVLEAETSRPIEGARITLSEEQVSMHPRYGWSGPAGRFQVGPLLPGDYYVTVERDGYLPERGRRFVVLPGQTPPVTLKLVRGAVLAGQVIDDTGRPVAGARIELVGRAEGHRIADRSWALAEAQARLSDAAMAPAAWSRAGTAPTPAELGLPGLGVVSMRGERALGASAAAQRMGVAAVGAGLGPAGVKSVAESLAAGQGDGAGAGDGASADLAGGDDVVPRAVSPGLGVVAGPVPPVPGADFLGDLTGGAGVPEGVGSLGQFGTDSQGRFRMTAVPPGAVALVVRHPRYVRLRSAPIRIRKGETGRQNLVLTLHPGTALEANVVDSKGLAVPGARVALSAPEDPFYQAVRVTDDQGRFSVSNLEGRVRLEIRADGFVPKVVTIPIPKEPSPYRSRLQLERAECELSGRVVDRRDLPVRGAALSLVSLSPRAPLRASGTTDARGAFRIEGLGRLDYAVRLRAAGFPEQRLELRCPGPEARIRLAVGGGLSFSVVEDTTGEPIRLFRFQLVRPGAPRVVRDGFAGEATVVPLAAGRYALRVRAAGYAEWRETVWVPAGKEPGSITRRDLVVRLRRAGRVSGWVRDARGLAVAGARVRIAGRQARTDAQGRFTIGSLPPGTHALVAEHPKAGSGRIEAVDVQPELTTRGLVVDLVPAGDSGPERLTARLQIRLRQDGSRIVVGQVAPASTAERAGLRPGDELVSVDGQDLDGLGLADVDGLLTGPAGSTVVLVVSRGGATLRRVARREIAP